MTNLPMARPEFARQRRRHPIKPIWFVREKGADGKWSKVPHYGYPMRRVNGRWVSTRPGAYTEVY